MIKKDDILELTVMDMGTDGEGICKQDNFTVFVHGAIIGDLIRVKITKVKKTYAIGKIIKLITPSEYRIESDCIYHKCGGCNLKNIEYKESLKIKEKIVSDCMTRIGDIHTPVENIVGMKEPFHYRNKSQYPVRRKDAVEIGFFEMKSHNLVDIEDCIVQHKLINEIILFIKEYLNNHPISIYSEKEHKGILRHIVTRISFKTEDIMVIFVCNSKTVSNEIKELSNILSKKFKKIKSIIQNSNTNRGNRVLGFENTTIYGEDKIIDYIEDIEFEISPNSFLQVNPYQTEKLYRDALHLADISAEDIVYDIYCGIGSISLFIAKKAKKVIGIEIVPEAIKDANKNKIRNHIDNVEFYTGKAEELLPTLFDKGVVGDVVFLDPPRKGCEIEVIDTLLQMKPKKIVYISCKPSTLARDLKLLSKEYHIEIIRPYDLFPLTMHVECIVLMSRK